MARKRSRDRNRETQTSNSSQETRSERARPSRREQFNRQRRNSWIKFLSKILLFVVPIFAVTTWMIVRLLSQGVSLPIITLDYDNQVEDDRRLLPVWHRVNFQLASNTPLKLKDPIRFGGPDRNVAVIFCDVLGDMRTINGERQPCVFVANSKADFETHAFQGLTESETELQSKQWTPLDSFLENIIQGVKEQATVRGRGKIIFALDVDHPDLPARLPPQANEFISRCTTLWETKRKELNEHFDVCLWLSHSPFQKSYLDSDPENVESFFKRRFELAITGDVLDENLNGRKRIHYSDIKQYLKRWVESDSDLHRLAQTPTFLEPESLPDFPVMEFAGRPETAGTCGTLFAYPKRSLDETIDADWKKRNDLARAQSWDLENPLLAQRTTLLLLQMEKLWYVGRSDSTLFADLRSQLNSILESTTTIAPYQHTLYDAHQNSSSPLALPDKLPLDWVSPIVAGVDQESVDAKKELQRRSEMRAQWLAQHAGWRGAMSVWLALRDTKEFNRQNLINALGILTTQQSIPSIPEIRTEIDAVDVPWNEIAYLKRINEELIWPTDTRDLVEFQDLVQQSIVVRDTANQLASKLAPVLSRKFLDAFFELETQRRLYEDKLFANDLKTLQTEFAILSEGYTKLDQSHARVANQFSSIQENLVAAPHDLRYAIESLVTQCQNGNETAARVAIVDRFKGWLSQERTGFFDTWANLGSQSIGAVMDDLNLNASQRMEASRKRIFSEIPDDSNADKEGFKRLATNPQRDQDWLSAELTKDNNQSDFIGVAEGNLLARRLLAWPGLNLERRNLIRRGLSESKNRVRPSGDNREANFEFSDAEVTSKLSEIFSLDAFVQLEPIDQPVLYNLDEKGNGDENFFVELAFAAHRRRVQRNAGDQTSRNVAVAVNDFRSLKSDFDFRRVAGDLWGGPQIRSQPFVIAALENHRNVVDFRVKNFISSTITDDVKSVWSSGPKKSWDARIEQARNFSEKFRKFKWNPEDQVAYNPELAGVQGIEFQDLELAIFPQRQFEAIRPSKFDASLAIVDATAFEGQSNKTLNLYLRGFEQPLSVSGRPQDPSLTPFIVEPDVGRFPGSEITVMRDELGPVVGHVTLVIDCSLSMNAKDEDERTRMARLKRDVVGFLEDMSIRGDVAVSMVAIGATELWKKQNDISQRRDASKIKSWEQVDGTDVWKYRQNGRRVDADNLEALTNGVKELEPFGDTPILSGLKTALELAEGQQQSLIVLLTDGFEFNNRDRKPSQLIAPLDETLYQNITSTLKESGTREAVVFSYLPSSKDNVLKEEFKSMIDSGIKLSEISQRVNRIERLADPAKVRYSKASNSLKAFLDDLLPKPIILAQDAQGLLFREKISYQAARDEPILSKQIGLERMGGGRWSIGVEFTEPKLAANGFARQLKAPWETPTSLVGNEKLQFVYEPFQPSLSLTSSKLAGDPVPFGDIEVVINLDGQRKRQPEFKFVAAQSDTLTPAPELAVIMFRPNANQSDREMVMLQDFLLDQQVSSNVHPIKFPIFDDVHREAAFGLQTPLDMELKLLRTIPPELWAKISFSEQEKLDVSANGKTVTLPTGDFGIVNDLLPSNDLYEGYTFRLRRLNDKTEVAVFTLIVESQTKPIDQWLVNIVDTQGRIDRVATQSKRRLNWYKENFDGTKKLSKIEHEFSINKERLKRSKLFFGIAHVKELSDTSDLKIDRYFSK